MAEGEKESARDVFGRRADRYAALDVFSQEKYYLPLLAAADPGPGDRVLDVAAGTGLLALMLARTAAEVVGADVTPEMLGLARERIMETGQTNISFVEAGAEALPFTDGRFDLVTCRTAFHHFPDPVAVLREIHRVLRSGGRLVIEDVYGPCSDAAREVRERFEKLLDASHVMAYRPAEVAAMLIDTGFEPEPVRKTAGEELSLDIMLKMDRIEDPEDREEIIALLEANQDVGLGGFSAKKVLGEFLLKWRTMIIIATAAP